MTSAIWLQMQRFFKRSRRSRDGRVARNTRRVLEVLEPRYTLSGVVAVGNDYTVAEDDALAANVILDDTGAGADETSPLGGDLVVRAIDGDPGKVGAPFQLANGATVTATSDGAVLYDPRTSASLNALADGETEIDTFDYTITQDYSNIYTFGDSLSDIGTLYQLTGETFPASPPYFEGRFSNGPVWVEHLAEQLGLVSDATNNFAVGGAQTGRDNIFDQDPLEFPGVQDQLDAYVDSFAPGEGADPDALYVVWAGPNDFVAMLSNPELNPIEVVQTAVDNLETTVDTLQIHGAEHILVANMPDLGVTPTAAGLGLETELTVLSGVFNTALAQALATLPPVIQVDMFTAIQTAVNHPELFGLTNVTDPCLDADTGTVCAAPDEYLFWDDIHPTASTHTLLGAVAFDALSDTATVSVTVQGDSSAWAEVVGGNLYVSGTPGNDRILFRTTWSGQIVAYVNWERFGSFAAPNAIFASGGRGHDYIDAGNTRIPAHFDGGAGNDILLGGRGDDELLGGDGCDVIFGRGGNDRLSGGAGRDALFGGSGNDWLDGGLDDDFLFGGWGDDQLDGGEGSDFLFGGPGDDTKLNG